MWTMIVMVTLWMPGQLPQSVALTSVPGFKSADRCRDQAKIVVNDFAAAAQSGVVATATCVDTGRK